ncbi:hypothetical protein [Actinokineospora inagensis]|uniref:hypothetical protein n=1 Tax=Actinokineospora inagensis TaxID=103730 RepID=UPI000421CC0A|nr:hypothetical protein [Actinokineospora inagensis]
MLSTWTTILRHLAGRLPDDDLATLRTLLAARELEDLERTLLFALADNAIGLSPTDRTLLAEVDFRLDSPIIADLPPYTPPTIAFHPDPTPSTVDFKLRSAAATYPIRRILRTHRTTDNKPLYLVELAPGQDIPRTQAALDHSLDGALLEVILPNEPLPPYQSAALAAALDISP